MLLKRIFPAVVVCLLFAPLLRAQSQKQLVATPDMQMLGVWSLSATFDSRGASADLQSDTGASLGHVEASELADGTHQVTITSPSDGFLTLYWRPLDRQLTLVDANGSMHVVYADAAGRVVQDGASEEAFNRHRAAIETAMHTASALLHAITPINRMRVGGNPKATCFEGLFDDGDVAFDLVQPDYSGSGGGGRLVCNGLQVRGTAYWLTGGGFVKSDLCNAAQDDANLQCSNRYCTGCCRFDSCDASCLVGDTACFSAGINGYLCSITYY